MSNVFYQSHDDWYWERFHHHAGQNTTYKAAYEATEEDWRDRFGCDRFNDYESFRQGKYRKYGKLKGPNK